MLSVGPLLLEGINLGGLDSMLRSDYAAGGRSSLRFEEDGHSLRVADGDTTTNGGGGYSSSIRYTGVNWIVM